jgi:hypothetical protein
MPCEQNRLVLGLRDRKFTLEKFSFPTIPARISTNCTVAMRVPHAPAGAKQSAALMHGDFCRDYCKDAIMRRMAVVANS